MNHKNFADFEEKEVTNFGSKKTSIRVFIDEKTAPNFVMRRFDIKSGGNIGLHNHPWEHEMYILDGELFLLDKDGNKEKVKAGEFVYMPPDEPHGYSNESDTNAAFLCVIPKK